MREIRLLIRCYVLLRTEAEVEADDRGSGYQGRRPMKVSLEGYEMRMADAVAAWRARESREDGYTDRKHDEASTGGEIDLLGARGEIAFAKATKLYWAPSVHTGKRPDVGPFHVRTTTHSSGKLIVRPRDVSGLFALVTGNDATYIVRGFVQSSVACVDRYWEGDAWWVPQEDLTRFDTTAARKELPSYLRDHLCRCGAYGCFGFGWPPKWRCGEHQHAEQNT